MHALSEKKSRGKTSEYLYGALFVVARLRSFMTDGQEEVVHRLCLGAERWVVLYTHMGWCDSMTEWLSWYNLLWSARCTTIRPAQIMEWLQWDPKLVDDAVAADRRNRVCCMLTAVVQEERPHDDRMRISMLYACAMLVYHYVMFGIGMDECNRGGQERYAKRYTERLNRDLHEAVAMLEAVESLLSELDGVKSVWYSKGFMGDFADRDLRAKFASKSSDDIEQAGMMLYTLQNHVEDLDEGLRYLEIAASVMAKIDIIQPHEEAWQERRDVEGRSTWDRFEFD